MNNETNRELNFNREIAEFTMADARQLLYGLDNIIDNLYGQITELPDEGIQRRRVLTDESITMLLLCYRLLAGVNIDAGFLIDVRNVAGVTEIEPNNMHEQ